MRKRNIKNLFDNIFWYTLYMLPIICYIIYLCVNPFIVPSIDEEVPVEPLTVTASAAEVTQEDLQLFGAVVFPSKFTVPLPEGFYLSSGDSFQLVAEYVYERDENTYIHFQSITFYVQNSAYIDTFTQGEIISNSLSSIIYCTVDEIDSVSYLTFENPLFVFVPSDLPLNSIANILFVDDSFSVFWRLVPEDIQSMYQSYYFFDSSLDLPSGDGETIIISPDNYTFEQFVEVLGFGFATDNIVVNTIQDIFGVDGIMPLFKGSTVAIITGWMVSVYLIHLAVDFILFIPRWGHKFLKNITED